MSERDGGPAFPREDYQTDYAPGQQGMSLRDYFAAKAMQGLSTDFFDLVGWSLDDIAKESYGIADAMMKAREL